MASPAVDIATGITIVFASSGFNGQIVDVNGLSLSREMIDVTHQGSTSAREFLPADFYDPGELAYTVHHNPDSLPPIDQPNETITLTWPAGATLVFTGSMATHNPTGTLNDKIIADVTLKATGVPVATAAP